GAADSIGAAMELGMDQARDRGRVVVQIDVDGRPIAMEQLRDEGFLSEGAELVEVTSLTEREMLLAALELGRNAIEVSQVHFTRSAELIQAGDRPAALAELGTGIELWRTVEGTVFRDAVPKVPLASLEARLETHLAELRTALETMSTAVGTGDLVALSDALMYEFPRTSATWTEFLGECMRSVEEQGTRTGTEEEQP
ncbi:MAG: hypothetical protein VXX86_06680, partial [Planctomycetota bacterium]|nr:hypothetical protein [Planctomycetota bacterium]